MADLHGIEYDLDSEPVHPANDSVIGIFSKILRSLEAEGQHFHPRLWLALLLSALLPIYIGSRLRTRLLSWAGFDIGKGTVFWGKIMITGGGNLYQQLHIGRACWFNIGCYLDLTAPVCIGNQVSIGHQVLFMTSSHEIGASARRAGAFVAKPIHIEDGAWLGSRVTILPGITVGEGAVVAAGALVNKDIPPNTLFAGVPAKFIRYLQ